MQRVGRTLCFTQLRIDTVYELSVMLSGSLHRNQCLVTVDGIVPRRVLFRLAKIQFPSPREVISLSGTTLRSAA